MTEPKEMSHLNVFEDSKTSSYQARYGELVKEQSFTNEDAEITQRYVGLPKVTSTDDYDNYEMPLDKSNIDDCYTDIVSVPPRLNEEKDVTINQPSCMHAESHVIQPKYNPVPPVPCRKNGPKEKSSVQLFDRREENPRENKKGKWNTTKTIAKFIVAIVIILPLSAVISFLMLRTEIGKLQADLQFLVLSSIDKNASLNMWESVAKLDKKVEQLEYKSNISLEEMANMTEMQHTYQDEFKYIKKALAVKEFSFERSTLYRDIYMSSDNRTISTHRTISGTTGSGSGFQNYKGVRGTKQFTNYDIIYFEVSFSYQIIGNATARDLVFEVGFSTENTIDGHHYVGYQNESWSFFCVTTDSSTIALGYQISGTINSINSIKTLSTNSLGTSYNGLFGFLVHGPKGEITLIDKQQNGILHTFERVDFTKHLYPVFAVFNPHIFNVTLTLITWL